MIDSTSLGFLIAVIVVALAFDFANGFNDAANAIATVISTRVMSPLVAVAMAGCMNFLGAVTGTAVAKTVGKGVVDPDIITLQVVAGEDILALAGSLDDVVDAIDEAAQYILEYQIEEPTNSARHLAQVIVLCADELEQALALLSTRGFKLKDILPMTIEINRLENEADQIASKARNELFNDNFETKQILKWRDIYDDLEQATDRAEDAADILEGIVLKHS